MMPVARCGRGDLKSPASFPRKREPMHNKSAFTRVFDALCGYGSPLSRGRPEGIYLMAQYIGAVA
jgi:hypothetical protein